MIGATNSPTRSAEGQMRTVQTWPAATEGCNGPLELTADRVDCWFVSLAAFPADAESLAVAILSKDERKRAAGFYFERQRQCYIRSHAALRLLLGRYLMTAPDAIAIVADTHGRPMLAARAGDLEFNLSHSGDAVLVGVSLHPLGVDIELVRDVPDFLEIAKRHFAPSEVEELLRLAPEQRCESFYVTWTRKEALVKALGLGLSFPLDAFCTGRQDRPRLTQVGGAVWSDWTIAGRPCRGTRRRWRYVNRMSRCTVGKSVGRGCSRDAETRLTIIATPRNRSVERRTRIRSRRPKSSDWRGFWSSIVRTTEREHGNPPSPPWPGTFGKCPL
jgi:4'-phosphopantetheinyl transferase